jgi:predicted XRE-type DNA-binding protein
MSKSKTQTYGIVWEALADTGKEAANLRVRSALMSEVAAKLAALMEEHHWTQRQAAGHCGVTQPRINDLLRGRMSRFSIDGLVNIAAALGLAVHVKMDGTSASAGRRSRYARGVKRRRRTATLQRGESTRSA